MTIEEKIWSGIGVKKNSMSVFYVVLSTCCVVLPTGLWILGKHYSRIILLRHFLKFCRKRKRKNAFMVGQA